MKLRKIKMFRIPKPKRVAITSEMVKRAKEKWTGHATVLPPAPDGARLGISREYEIFENILAG